MTEEGGVTAALSAFREIWLCDFEFVANDGERVWPVCMVASEYHSGRTLRLWRDDLLKHAAAPFDIGSDSLFVSYSAAAELSCFLVLGWPLPANILDLFAEFRCNTNGLALRHGTSLIGALLYHGLPTLDARYKAAMRDKIIQGGPWSSDDERAILEYCETDVVALGYLLPKMIGGIKILSALCRGRFAKAAAHIEQEGVPVDIPTWRALLDSWENISLHFIRQVDVDYGVYDGTTFKEARFVSYLVTRGIPWPKTPTGRLKTDDETFRYMSEKYPQLLALHRVRSRLSALRLHNLPVGSDGRNRFSAKPFWSATGRNQPSPSEFVFGPARWVRGLIKPPPGYGVAYIDWCAQEFAIAAALSGDERMMDAYLSGDQYIQFGKDAGLIPPNGTKESHGEIRAKCKVCVLGLQYGRGIEGVARELKIPVVEARELVNLHQRTYKTFWRWSKNFVSTTMLTNQAKTILGWKVKVGPKITPLTLMNWPMQSHGADMMRITAFKAVEEGINVIAPVHDAFMM